MNYANGWNTYGLPKTMMVDWELMVML